MRADLKSVLALLLAAVVVVSTSAAAGGATSVRRVIKVAYTETASRFQDTPPKSSDSVSKGDVLTGIGLLRNSVPQFGMGKDAVVGSEEVRLAWKNKSVVIATLTATLPDGTLRASSAINTTRARAVVRVINGTGAYKGAKGSVTSFSLGQDPSGKPLFARVYNLIVSTQTANPDE